jgi:hypothetical protein
VESQGGPFATGNIGWISSAGATYVILFAIAPELGNGSSWTTTTLVDATGEQASAERMIFGADGGVTYSLSETDLQPLGLGFATLGVLGEPDKFRALDRVYLTCSAKLASQVGISFTVDGGATWSNEIVISISPSKRGVFTGTGWNISMVTEFQPKFRIIAGDVIIHEGVFYAQPHGRAA